MSTALSLGVCGWKVQGGHKPWRQMGGRWMNGRGWRLFPAERTAWQRTRKLEQTVFQEQPIIERGWWLERSQAKECSGEGEEEMGSERRPDRQGFYRPGYGIQTVHGAYVALFDGPSFMSQVYVPSFMFGFEFSWCRVRDRVSKAGAFIRKQSCEESGHCVYGLGVCLPDAKFILSLGGAVGL